MSMPLRVLIAPDKFKGTLTASQAAQAIARGWRSIRKRDGLTLLPITDGGDGFGDTMRRLLRAQRRTASTVDAAHRRVRAPWWWQGQSRLAVVESARVIGLAMLPAGRYHPFELDTEGLGVVLRAAAAGGARVCLVGIGGSATNDGGFGLARSLGWRFLDRNDHELTAWIHLSRLAKVIPPPQCPLDPMQVIVATDVHNRLLGPLGATRVYGPQKGIRPGDHRVAEAALGRLAQIMSRHLGVNVAALPGAGAAGGLGFGLTAFAGARLQNGFELFSAHSDLEAQLSRADLVLTGEGSLDRSTLMGKGVGEVARCCAMRDLPCIGLGGVVADGAKLARQFHSVHAIAPALVSADAARRRAAHWLAALAGMVARQDLVAALES